MALLTASSEEFFFDSPKKYILDFLEAIKEKKEIKKKPAGNNIQHYHVHYYPPQIRLVSAPPVKAPEKYDLDKVHNEHLESLGWSDYEYKFIPSPKFSYISKLRDLWNDQNYFSWDRGSVESDLGTVDRSENEGILVQVPLSHEIVIQPQSKQKKKSSLLEDFFKKTADSKNVVHQ